MWGAAIVVVGAALLVGVLSRGGGASSASPRRLLDPDLLASIERWRKYAEDEAGDMAALVLAVIARESRGDANAIGGVGEIGLMQLTRAAWTDYQMERNDPEANPFPDAVMDPKINIRVGSWFLRRKIEEMGSLYHGLRAYNCGTTGAKTSPTCGANYATWITETGLPAFRRIA